MCAWVSLSARVFACARVRVRACELASGCACERAYEYSSSAVRVSFESLASRPSARVNLRLSGTVGVCVRICVYRCIHVCMCV